MTCNAPSAPSTICRDEGPRRLSGQRLEFDLDSETGTMYEGEAFVDPDLFFSGAQIEKVGEDVYVITDGMISSCSEDQVPDWSFKLGRAQVRVGRSDDYRHVGVLGRVHSR